MAKKDGYRSRSRPPPNAMFRIELENGHKVLGPLSSAARCVSTMLASCPEDRGGGITPTDTGSSRGRIVPVQVATYP